VTRPGIDPGTFRLVATPGPSSKDGSTLNFRVKEVLDKLTACFVKYLPMNTASHLTKCVFTASSVVENRRNQLHTFSLTQYRYNRILGNSF
jgi:hypothetical protein